MMTLFIFIVLNILIVDHTVHGTNYGYRSICDLLPSGPIWLKNHGYELKSWIGSIVPYPIDNSVGVNLAKFIVTKKYLNLKEVHSITGISWKAYGDQRFDGWLYGVTDVSNMFADPQTYYIFPDFKTAFIGKFENDEIMLEGIATNVTHYRCNNGVMELKFAKPKKHSVVFKTIQRTHTFASATPHERDPMGKRNVYIGSSINVPSIANQNALFARKDIAPHDIVAYYNGIWETFEEPYFTENMTEVEKLVKHKNLLNYNDTHCLDVTPQMSDLKNYISTLGHKANHHFILNNVNFCYAKHPVFGEIMCLESRALIQRNDEILINYNYNVFEDDAPKWYKDLYYYIYPHKQGSTMSMIEDHQ